MWIIEEKTPLNPRLKGIEKRAPHKYVDFFAKKWGILAKKPTGGLLKGEKKKIIGENCKKTYQGGKGPEIPINRIRG